MATNTSSTRRGRKPANKQKFIEQIEAENKDSIKEFVGENGSEQATADTTIVKTDTSAPVQDNSALAQENDLLKQQLAALQAQMQMLSNMVATQNQAPTAAPVVKDEKQIRFISLVPGRLVLRGTKFWTIEGQFKSLTFYEDEAKAIVNNSHNAVTEGYVYIDDAEFVAQNRLIETYRRLLKPEQMEKMFDEDPRIVINAYKNGEQGMKDSIINMVMARKLKGEFVDANILVELGQLSGRDLVNIEQEKEDN